MIQSIQASKVSFATLRDAFGLTRNRSPQFFTEWLALDSAVNESEIQAIDVAVDIL